MAVVFGSNFRKNRDFGEKDWTDPMYVSMQHSCLSHQHERSSTEAGEAEAASQENRKAQGQDFQEHGRANSGLSAFKEKENLMERSYQPAEG